MNTRWSYDAIAEVYATDMGQSMPFDDVGWYRAVCREHPGPVLELGCGTGRILIELLAAGIDATGADRSLPMLARLRRDAAARGLAAPPLLQMDLRAPALHAVAGPGPFRVILLPYSLITYLTDPRDAVTLLAQLRGLLAPDGSVVLDAFIPRPVESFSDFRLDYRRAHDGGWLERHKRITALADGCNRIERRYRLRAADDGLREEFHTDETIRPYDRAALRGLATAAGYAVRQEVLDYAAGSGEPRFASLILG